MDDILTIQDIRAAGICGSGARRWFEQHGFDFRDFMKNGIPADRLIATGDAMALKAVEQMRKRLGG